MEWIKLVNEETLDSIKNDSAIKPVVLFKHSTRCSISATALSRLERAWSKEEMAEIKYYYLDLLNYRNISQKIESVFGIGHESPQLLIISNGSCVYNSSHMSINYQEIKQQLNNIVVKN